MKTLLCLFLTLLLGSAWLSAQQMSSGNETAYYENSIIHSTRNSTKHTTLSSAIIAAELDEVLNSDGPFTVFAPSDDAFNKLNRDEIKALFLPVNKEKLQSLLSYHMIAGHLSASKILRAMCRGEGVATFTTVQGKKLTATMEGIDIVLQDDFGNKARIMVADENRCNGVIHVIDSVVLPKKLL